MSRRKYVEAVIIVALGKHTRRDRTWDLMLKKKNTRFLMQKISTYHPLFSSLLVPRGVYSKYKNDWISPLTARAPCTFFFSTKNTTTTFKCFCFALHKLKFFTHIITSWIAKKFSNSRSNLVSFTEIIILARFSFSFVIISRYFSVYNFITRISRINFVDVMYLFKTRLIRWSLVQFRKRKKSVTAKGKISSFSLIVLARIFNHLFRSQHSIKSLDVLISYIVR